jgi:hypothetical protein
MSKIPPLIAELSFDVSEILNDKGNPRRPEGYFRWEPWRIDREIINLLTGRSYCGISGKPKYARLVVGKHMSGYDDAEGSACDYFRCVFEYPISSREPKENGMLGGTKALPPTDRLQNHIRSHCLDSEKHGEKNLSPVSLWDIFKRAGETIDNSRGGQVCYHYFEGEALQRLKCCVLDVLLTANRHYSTLYSLGLYPPQYINDIKAIQAIALDRLIKHARKLAGENGDWKKQLPIAWAEKPLTKIGDRKLPDYDAFIAHDLIQRMLDLQRKKLIFVPYDNFVTAAWSQIENGDEEDANLPLMEEGIDDEHIDSYEEEEGLEDKIMEKIKHYAAHLNEFVCTPHERELLFALLNHFDISPFVKENEDDDAFYARLKKLLLRLKQYVEKRYGNAKA